MLLGAVVAASLVVEPAWAVDRLADLLGHFLPAGTLEVERIVEEAVANRRRVGVFAIISWVLAGRRVLGALVSAINRVSDVDEHADSLRRRAAVELVLLLGVGLLFGLALSAGPLVELLWGGAEALPGPRQLAVEGLTVVLRALLLLAAFTTLYAIVPQGKRGRQPVLIGAVAATGLFLAAHAVSVTALRWAWDNLSLVYGPLAVATVLLLWAWYVGMIVLFGASLASHVKTMRLEGQSPASAAHQHSG